MQSAAYSVINKNKRTEKAYFTADAVLLVSFGSIFVLKSEMILVIVCVV
jgi:hypothetical protein